MRTGVKTVEFWLGIIAAAAIVVQKQFFPEHPFPEESFMVLGMWVAARLGEKTLSATVAKRAWLSSEFWVALGFGIVKAAFPSLPEGLETFVYTYIIGRPAIKVAGSPGKLLTNVIGGKK